MTNTAEADLSRAESLVGRALASSPRSPLPHYAKGQLLRAQRRYAEAIPEYETVLALDRNWVSAFFGLGVCKLITGSIEDTNPLVERAIQLSPRDPELGVWYQLIGQVHLLQSRTDEAILWLEKARNHSSAHSMIHADLASAYALHCEMERAAAELTEARRLSSDRGAGPSSRTHTLIGDGSQRPSRALGNAGPRAMLFADAIRRFNEQALGRIE
jgi:tetratricopeptide (TPR) repeat protein